MIKSERIVFRPGKMLREAIENYGFEKIPDPSDKENGGAEFSFLDFARLIRSGYHRAWSFSRQPEAYAKEIAYSPYISEQNGDNREQYRRSLIAIHEMIVTLKDMYDWMRGRAA